AHISFNKVEKAIALNQYSCCRHSFQRGKNALLDLVVVRNHPMDIAGTCIPEAPGVFACFIILLTTGTDEGLVAKQIAYAASKRIFSARSVMASRQLDRFPSGQALQ